MEEKKVWSTADIIKNRNNWTLASDVELLKHIQSLSEKFVRKSRSTLQLLNSFENDVNDTCTSLANINNRFGALSDTQFVENKIRDDSSEVEVSTVPVQHGKGENNESITVKLNEALSNGIQVLRTQYDIIALTDSDSEDEEPQEVLLKARNPFMSRKLPYIIGSEEFSKHDHLGLVTSSEDEDDEKESEVEDEDDDDYGHFQKKTLKPEPVKNEFFEPRTQVIQVSSDSEDSEFSFPEREVSQPTVVQNDVNQRTSISHIPQGPTTFADHLNATLRNVDRNTITPLVDNLFSPPPLPINDDDQSVSNDETSDDSDIFAPSKRDGKPQTKSHILPDEFVDESFKNDGSGKIIRKSSITSDSSQFSDITPASKPVHVASIKESYVPPNTRGNVSTTNAFSAVNAELSRKFKKIGISEDDLTINNQDDSMYSKSSSPISQPRCENPPVMKPINSNSLADDLADSKKVSAASMMVDNATSKSTSTAITSKLSNSAPNSRENDISSTSFPEDKPVAVAPQKPIKPKVVSLFDDDDSMDELFNSNFNSKNAKRTAAIPSGVNDSDRTLFDNPDVFPNEKGKEQMPGKRTTTSTINTAANFGSKKMDLFNDDSDSGDDIFAIINSQRKKSAPNVTNAKHEEKSLMPGMFGRTDSAGGPRDLFASIEKQSEAMSKMCRDYDSSTAKNEEEEHFTAKNSHISKPKDEHSKKFFDRVDEFEDDNKKSEGECTVKNSNDTQPKNKGSKKYFDSDDECEDLFATEPKTKSPAPSISSQQNPCKLPQNSVVPENDESNSEVSFARKDNESFDPNVFLETVSKPDTFLQSKVERKKEALVPKDETLHFDRFENSASITKPNVIPAMEALNRSPPTVGKLRLSSDPKINSSEVTDGSTSSQIDQTQTSVAKTPAKLAAHRRLNINVAALLPGSSWSPRTKMAEENIPETTSKTTPVATVEPNLEEKSYNLSTAVAKERLKVSTKRRPPSRRARVNKALQSDLFATNSVSRNNNDEPDSTDKRVDESIPDKATEVTRRTEVNSEKIDDFTLPLTKKDDVLPEEFASARTSRSYRKEREESIRRAQKEPSTVSTSPTGKKDENQIANDLGNILITASSSREPPAMIEDDFTSWLNDSDKDEDPFDEVIGENENVIDPIPPIHRENSNSIPDIKNSRLFSESKTSVIKKSTSFDLYDKNHSDNINILHKLPSSDTPSPSTSNAVSISIEPAKSEIENSTRSNSLHTVTEKRISQVKAKFSEETSSPHQDIHDQNNIKSDEVHLGEKSSSALFSFDEDISDDDLDGLFSKVITTKNVLDSKFNEVVLTGVTSDESLSKLKIKHETLEIFNSKTTEDEISSNSLLKNDFEKDCTDFETSNVSQDSSTATNIEGENKFPKISTKISADLFADDDDDNSNALFTSNKTSSITTKKQAAKSLFEDDDDNDDSLFGSTLSTRNKNTKGTTSKEAKSRNHPEKVRVVKLRCQAVERDPLTGKINE